MTASTRYRTLFENALSGVLALQEVVCDEDGEPVDFVTLAVNPAFEEQTGLRAEPTSWDGSSVRRCPAILEPTSSSAAGAWRSPASAERGESDVRGARPAPGHPVRVVPREGQFAAIVLDVTERARGRGEAAAPHAAARGHRPGVAAGDRGGRRGPEVVLWNPGRRRHLRVAPPRGARAAAAHHPADLEAQAESLLRRLLAGSSSPASTCRACARTASASTQERLTRAHARGRGRAGQRLIIFEDVTERRAERARLARLTRLYQELSAVTEAIPEERDPDRLFEKVCGIVVAQGGFRRAWLGRKRRNGLVQVVASAGAEDAPGADGEERAR